MLGLSFEVINKKIDAEPKLLFSHTTVESVSPKLQILHIFFSKMERELKKVGVTAEHMWEHYIALDPNGYGNSQRNYLNERQFCEAERLFVVVAISKQIKMLFLI